MWCTTSHRLLAPRLSCFLPFFPFYLSVLALLSYVVHTSHVPIAAVPSAGLQILLLGLSAACMFATSVLVGFLDGPPHGKPLPPPLNVDIESSAMDSPLGHAATTPVTAARVSLERRNSSGAARTLPSPAASAAAAAGIFPGSNPPAHTPNIHPSPRHLSGGRAGGGHLGGGAAGGPGDGAALRLPMRLLRRRNGVAAAPRRMAASMRPFAWVCKCGPRSPHAATTTLCPHAVMARIAAASATCTCSGFIRAASRVGSVVGT